MVMPPMLRQVEVISIHDAHRELKKAVEEAGGVTKFLHKHGLDRCHRSNLRGAMENYIKPQPMFLRCIGIHRAYVRIK